MYPCRATHRVTRQCPATNRHTTFWLSEVRTDKRSMTVLSPPWLQRPLRRTIQRYTQTTYSVPLSNKRLCARWYLFPAHLLRSSGHHITFWPSEVRANERSMTVLSPRGCRDRYGVPFNGTLKHSYRTRSYPPCTPEPLFLFSCWEIKCTHSWMARCASEWSPREG